MSAFDVWLWLKLDDIRDGLCTAFAVFGVICLVPAIALCAEKVRKWSALACTLVFIGWAAGVASVLIPSTKQAAAIYVVPQLVESRVFTNDIPQLYGMAVDALKEKLAVEVSK